MAQLTSVSHRRVEELLARCEAAWRSLRRVEAEISRWDLLDRIDFVEEWPLEEQRLRELARYAEAGALAPHQSDRYAKLLLLIERNRPIIRRLQQN